VAAPPAWDPALPQARRGDVRTWLGGAQQAGKASGGARRDDARPGMTASTVAVTALAGVTAQAMPGGTARRRFAAPGVPLQSPGPRRCSGDRGACRRARPVRLFLTHFR
jgi:hypothetical protein